MKHKDQILTEAFKEHKEALFRFCFFRVSNRDKALDIVQETFTKVWLYLVNDNTINDIKPFLYTTARHLIIDEYRKKKTLSLDVLLEQGMESLLKSDDSVYISDDVARTLQYIHRLPDVYSSIMIMRYVNDFSVQHIASITNTSENVISVRIHRGLGKLRVIMFMHDWKR